MTIMPGPALADAVQPAGIQLTPEQIEEYRDAFDVFDRDKSGSISAPEIYAVMTSLGRTPTPAQVGDMIKQMDLDQDGEVDFEEFLVLMKKDFEREMAEACRDRDGDVMMVQDGGEKYREAIATFASFDTDGDGKVDAQELASVMSGIGENLKDSDIAQMIKAADEDGDGRVNFAEFRKMTGAV